MTHDIIIIGGGMVGLTLACALAQKTSLSIAVLEASEKKLNPHRVSAISLSSKRIFSQLNVWQDITSSPFTNIEVWDANQTPIQFDGLAIAESVLGYLVENDVIQAALENKLKNYVHVDVIEPVELAAFEAGQLTATNGDQFKAKLVIAADGARSWLREQVGIQVETINYEQQGVVATVKTALPHKRIARQVFLTSGPLAFLPLADANTSSIVWSMPTEHANQMLKLSDDEFKGELSKAFNKLDGVVDTSKRFAFPLYYQQAERYSKQGIALVGDAAHVMHPLAGQGVNTGLLDAARLAEVVLDAYSQGRRFDSLATLRRYERWSRADNQLMLAGIDKLKKIFANDKPSAQRLVSVGLKLTNELPLLKNVFMRHAIGNREGLPILAL